MVADKFWTMKINNQDNSRLVYFFSWRMDYVKSVSLEACLLAQCISNPWSQKHLAANKHARVVAPGIKSIEINSIIIITSENNTFYECEVRKVAAR